MERGRGKREVRESTHTSIHIHGVICHRRTCTTFFKDSYHVTESHTHVRPNVCTRSQSRMCDRRSLLGWRLFTSSNAMLVLFAEEVAFLPMRWPVLFLTSLRTVSRELTACASKKSKLVRTMLSTADAYCRFEPPTTKPHQAVGFEINLARRPPLQGLINQAT